MKKFLALAALILAACTSAPAPTTLGPDTYQLVHTMPTAVPNTGTRRAMVNTARTRCNQLDDAPYIQKSEDIKIHGAKQTITLTYQCKPLLKGSGYTGSYADTIPTPQIVVPQENLVSLTAPIPPK